MAVALSVMGLPLYGMVDSILILSASSMTRSRKVEVALIAQGVAGVAVGSLLLLVLYDQVRVEWFFDLIAIQAFCAGIAETVVARHTTSHAKTVWNYAVTAIAFVADGVSFG